MTSPFFPFVCALCWPYGDLYEKSCKKPYSLYFKIYCQFRKHPPKAHISSFFLVCVYFTEQLLFALVSIANKNNTEFTRIVTQIAPSFKNLSNAAAMQRLISPTYSLRVVTPGADGSAVSNVHTSSWKRPEFCMKDVLTFLCGLICDLVFSDLQGTQRNTGSHQKCWLGLLANRCHCYNKPHEDCWVEKPLWRRQKGRDGSGLRAPESTATAGQTPQWSLSCRTRHCSAKPCYCPTAFKHCLAQSGRRQRR